MTCHPGVERICIVFHESGSQVPTSRFLGLPPAEVPHLPIASASDRQYPLHTAVEAAAKGDVLQ